MKRGEIWWAELGAPAGRRPVLLLSRNEAYLVRELVTVAPVTTRIRNIPSEVPLGLEDGLSKSCVINLDTISTIAKTSLSERLTILSTEKVKAAETALHFALGMDN
ncbi:MAG: type II toxin-antitoxin system PemK/MazF family toxin [Dehalococcoidales bacterium]|nr:type II toxin-antitoxin system PemK/MazF family toxin [Dehalococcoidales bacterium]